MMRKKFFFASFFCTTATQTLVRRPSLNAHPTCTWIEDSLHLPIPADTLIVSTIDYVHNVLHLCMVVLDIRDLPLPLSWGAGNIGYGASPRYGDEGGMIR